ncbi:hypothetical protein SASPL_130840 [Salvia splendens]|uniref:UDP-glucuronate decarboxylase n=2 Tax=Salvia splendens TaxID=180675 RepID=A0A4D9C720_SALSN|nr:hypothetical protein SASPL_130821 [Salvia splendens]KAG6407841.1 hypothetical protein SASPL_130840 [Salvia splendens]
MCEICHQQFKPGYTAPPPIFRFGGLPMNLRGNWQIARRDLNNPRIIAMVAADHSLLDPEYDEYAASTSRSIVCCRTLALIFMVLLIIRHTLPVVVSRAGNYSLSLIMEILEMAKEASNGSRVSTKPPPEPSPLRRAKFFQANMRVLVTGGAGFIGSHLVDKLMQNEKNEVIVVDNYFTGSKDNLRQWIGHPRFELIRHDVTEPLFVEVDRIYHLACPASPIFYKYNPVKTIKTNVVGTLNMLGLAKRVGARILLTSTSEVYGDPLVHPQTEDYWGNVNPIGVRSCYDEGKRVAETLMYDYHRLHGVEIRIARIFNTYGPRMNLDDGRVVSNFLAQAIRDEPLTVQLPGTQTRSFCYVSEMVDGLTRLMEGDHIGPINIGNPGEFTMLELAETVKEMINPKVKITTVENTPDDPRQRKPDITKAKELLGWEPKIKLNGGIPLMEEDFRKRLGISRK